MNDDALLNELAAALHSGPPEPTAAELDSFRAAVAERRALLASRDGRVVSLAARRRMVLRPLAAAAAITMLFGTAALATGEGSLTRGARTIAHTIGLPVDAPAGDEDDPLPATTDAPQTTATTVPAPVIVAPSVTTAPSAHEREGDDSDEPDSDDSDVDEPEVDEPEADDSDDPEVDEPDDPDTDEPDTDEPDTDEPDDSSGEGSGEGD